MYGGEEICGELWGGGQGLSRSMLKHYSFITTLLLGAVGLPEQQCSRNHCAGTGKMMELEGLGGCWLPL